MPAIAAVKTNDLALAHPLAVQAVLRLHEAGARAVVLACTETPLAIDHAPSAATPLCIDATRALARACVTWYQSATAAGAP